MRLRAIPLLAALLSGFAAPLAAARPVFPDCEAAFAAAPETEQAVDCFYTAARNQGLVREAVGRLEELLAGHPDHPWLLLYLGHLRWDEPARAEGPYRRAAAAFAARGDAAGQIRAHTSLHGVLTKLGRFEEAAAEVETVAAIARRAGDPLLTARADVLQAKHLRLRGGDLQRAYALLHAVRDRVVPDGPPLLQRDVLEELANVSNSLGWLSEARQAYGQLAELARAHGDRRGEANARYGALRVLAEELTEVPRPEVRAQIGELAREVLAAASAVEYREMAGRAHLILGQLARGAEAREHLLQCAEDLVAPADRISCLTVLATREEDPQAALRTIREALTLAREAQDPWSSATVWRERMRVSWAALPRDQAIAHSQIALDMIEMIRDGQSGDAGRAGLLSIWAEDYYWFAGRLLEDAAAGGGSASLDEAFGVMERLRARTLLETLEAARAGNAANAGTGSPRHLRDRHERVLNELARVQRRLLDPELPEAERETTLGELRRLEIEESSLRAQLPGQEVAGSGAPGSPGSPGSPGPDTALRPGFAVVREVRRALAADEALLSFQIGSDEGPWGDFGGGSWLLVTTRDGARAYRLRRDRVALRPAVRLFAGLFERRDGAEERPAAGLYEDLLGAALRELPAGIRRIVLVPDDALHQLPFAALRAAPGAPPLAERYEIEIVPSATLWLRWRSSRPAAAAGPVLALADPVPLGGTSGSPSTQRAALFGDPVRLGPLPYARREGRAAVRHLRGDSLLRVGDEASEGFLKKVDLRQFAILHFATHTVVDDQNPERSGVLLTPAPEAEDGLLQIREIVPLDLDGRIVVLSSCRSASGTVLRGEGVLGIARAFFQAGAQTVVASLWPLRDDDGAALFDRFYRHLAMGKSVAAALRAAQLDRIADGAPAYAWAGLVVLGEGGLIPLPGGRRSWLGVPWLWVAAAGTLLLGVAGTLLVRRRRIAGRA